MSGLPQAFQTQRAFCVGRYTANLLPYAVPDAVSPMKPDDPLLLPKLTWWLMTAMTAPFKRKPPQKQPPRPHLPSVSTTSTTAMRHGRIGECPHCGGSSTRKTNVEYYYPGGKPAFC